MWVVELAAILELLLVGGTSAGTMKMMAATEVDLGGIHEDAGYYDRGRVGWHRSWHYEAAG